MLLLGIISNLLKGIIAEYIITLIETQRLLLKGKIGNRPRYSIKTVIWKAINTVRAS